MLVDSPNEFTKHTYRSSRFLRQPQRHPHCTTERQCQPLLPTNPSTDRPCFPLGPRKLHPSSSNRCHPLPKETVQITRRSPPQTQRNRLPTNIHPSRLTERTRPSLFLRNSTHLHPRPLRRPNHKPKLPLPSPRHRTLQHRRTIHARLRVQTSILPLPKEQWTCIPPRLQPRQQIHRRRILS